MEYGSGGDVMDPNLVQVYGVLKDGPSEGVTVLGI
jgi:hypothetical protein